MQSNIFSLNWKDVISAVISAVIVAVLGYISAAGNILNIDGYEVLNVAVLTAITSLLKSLGTDSSGRLLGGIKIK